MGQCGEESVKKRYGRLFLYFFLCIPFVRAQEVQSPSTEGRTLPAQERFVYLRKIGDKVDDLVLNTRLVKDADETFYELTTQAPDQTGYYKLSPETLFGYYSDITTRTKDTVIRRTTTIIENRIKLKDNELLLSSTDTISQTLRIFPWGRVPKARIVFPGFSENSSGFSFELTVLGKETININGKEYPCWKAQLGLGGIFGAVFGKTLLYFSTTSPSYLLKSDGVVGPPGTPRTILELKNYSPIISS
jgi:hypothetical protein